MISIRAIYNRLTFGLHESKVLRRRDRVIPETHKGLKQTCNSHMFALFDAREYSFSQVPYLEREEEITDQSNFVNDVT